jgi:hypothetical protein
VTYRRLALLLAIICAGCKEPGRQATAPAAGPQVRATVVNVRTTTHPGNRTRHHAIVIAGNLARDTSERDTWRLYDTKAGRVTFVDDVAKTIRTEPMEALIGRRRSANANELPAHYPRPLVSRTEKRRRLQGVSAAQLVITAGDYRRELWLAEHPSIPSALFAMMHAAETSSTPLAPMMRSVDEELFKARGFPLDDIATVAYGDQKLVVERMVVGIRQRDVPQSLVTVPEKYVDLTPAPAAKKK